MLPAKGGETVSRKGQKYQVNTFRRKQYLAPFHSMKRGIFMPRRREFRRKIQKKEMKK